MSRFRHHRMGRRTVGIAWLAVLVLLSAAAIAENDPPQEATQDDFPVPVVRDTVGQSVLRWQIDHPEYAASLYQADRSIYRIIDGEAITYHYGNVYIDRDTIVTRADSVHVFDARDIARLFDNVRLRHFDTRLACDWAEYRQRIGEADMRGHVRVDEDDAIVTSERGELRDDFQINHMFGNAVLISPEYTILADTLLRDRRLEYSEAFGHVRIMDTDGGSLVTGDHGLFATDGSWARVDLNPVLETREEDREPVHSLAGDMTFYRAEERVVMTDSVSIFQGHLRAYADTTISYGKERMLLLGEPRLEQGTRSRMNGETIEFFYRDGALFRVVLLGNARMEDTEPDSLAAIYRGLPEYDVIEGDSITVHFRDGKIYRTDAVGNAYSVYVPVDVEDEVSFNEVRGDTLVLRFHNQRVREVDVRGNMSGTYRFARIEAMRGPAIPDSATVDSLSRAVEDTLAGSAVDTLAAAASDTFGFNDHAEDVLYEGHSVTFDLARKSIAISGDASLKYGTMTLSGRDVILDTESRELYADGDPLLEDSAVIAGDQMGYDFGNRTGSVRGGITDFDGFYYVGETINRYPDGSLKIRSGQMTSCDRPEPHYHFWADRMKMRLGDKVVAAPIVLKVGHVPVFALPFYFKSLKEGRRSGILWPSFEFGWSSREGRYIRDFGYFWAVNDYTDLAARVDYNERRELGWSLQNRYKKRYAFDGSFEYNALRPLSFDDAITEWQLKWRHTQPALFDDYNFRAKVDLSSPKLSRNNLSRDTGRDVIDGTLKSSATVSRNFGFGALSLSADRTEFTNAADDDPNSDVDISQMTLPSARLSLKKITLGRPLGPGEDGSWLGNLGRATDFSQNYSLSSKRTVTEETRSKAYAGQGSWSLSVRPERFFFLNPTMSTRGALSWNRSDLVGRDFDSVDSTWTDISETTDESRPTLSFSSGLSTKFYGLFPLKVGALRALRHTLGANVTAEYKPKLGSKQERSESLRFSVDNGFSAKYLSGTAADSTATERKLDNFLTWRMSTSYNPDRDRMWGNIASGFSIKPGASTKVNIQLASTIDTEDWIWKLDSATVSYNNSFKGRLDTGFLGRDREEERRAGLDRLGPASGDSTAAADSLGAGFGDQWNDPVFLGDGSLDGDPRMDDRRPDTGGGSGERDDTEGGRFIPWTFGGNMSLNDAKGRDLTSRGNLRVGAQITRDWSFNYTASFDFREGRTVRQEYRLQRNMHCWRLEFMRTVSDNNSEYAFRFYLLAIPELKLTRGKDDMLGMARGLSSGLGMGGI